MREWPERAIQRKEWKAMGETFAQQWDKIRKFTKTNIFSEAGYLSILQCVLIRYIMTLL